LGDDVFTALCIARVGEPTSKLDSLRILADLGIHQFDKNQLYRCLQKVIDKDYRSTIVITQAVIYNTYMCAGFLFTVR